MANTITIARISFFICLVWHSFDKNVQINVMTVNWIKSFFIKVGNICKQQSSRYLSINKSVLSLLLFFLVGFIEIWAKSNWFSQVYLHLMWICGSSESSTDIEFLDAFVSSWFFPFAQAHCFCSSGQMYSQCVRLIIYMLIMIFTWNVYESVGAKKRRTKNPTELQWSAQNRRPITI